MRRAAVPLAVGAAFLWGVAEGTVFYVVADVLLTFVALRLGWRVGLAASLAAAAGALCAGAYLWHLAVTDPPAAFDLLDAVPFIDPDRIERGIAAMNGADWPAAMFIGSLTGMPYKIFAVGAGENGIPLLLFLAVSLPVRLARFLVASSLAAAFGAMTAPRLSPRIQTLLVALFWVVFYGQFWIRMSMQRG